MKLYVCYGTWTAGAPVHRHPCGEAHKALAQAGYRPDVVRSYGLGLLPSAINDLTSGRREVKQMTGNYWVPVLVLDDRTVIQGSRKIADWAAVNPARASTGSDGPSSAESGSAESGSAESSSITG
jgi:hypothetical protein